MNPPARPVMSAEDYRLFREFTAELFGIVLDEGRDSYLAQRLVPRLQELFIKSFADYYAYLKYSPHRHEEYHHYISQLTNNETYFFREEAQLDVFAQRILPLIRERKSAAGLRRIRIVSAGCSSGEEVYTLAMLLLESGHFLWDWDIMVTGIDIDSRIIAAAKRGVYSGRAFQTTPAKFIERYFHETGEGLEVKRSLRNITSFVHGNLLNLNDLLQDGSVDIIFCRNVLIYFGSDTSQQIVADFAQALTGDGLLFLGHSESFARTTHLYHAERFPGAIIYRKRGDR